MACDITAWVKVWALTKGLPSLSPPTQEPTRKIPGNSLPKRRSSRRMRLGISLRKDRPSTLATLAISSVTSMRSPRRTRVCHKSLISRRNRSVRKSRPSTRSIRDSSVSEMAASRSSTLLRRTSVGWAVRMGAITILASTSETCSIVRSARVFKSANGSWRTVWVRLT